MRARCNQTRPAAGLGTKGNARMTSTVMGSVAEFALPRPEITRILEAR